MMAIVTKTSTASAFAKQQEPITVPPATDLLAALKEVFTTIGDHLVATGSVESVYTERVPESLPMLWTPPSVIDPAQAWFWTKEWQTGEALAQADLDAGMSRTFATAEEFLEALGD